MGIISIQQPTLQVGRNIIELLFNFCWGVDQLGDGVHIIIIMMMI